MAPQLAWVGFGNMGRGMCKNLVEKGNLDKPLIISSRTAKRAEDFSKIGHSTVAPSIDKTAAKPDIVFLCLADDASINENVEKILKGMSRTS